MRYIRIMIAIICSVCFASATMASTQMQCCMDDAPEQSMAMPMESDMQMMPCHGDMPEQKAEQPSKVDYGCDCSCTLHSVTMPEHEPLARLAVNAPFYGVQPQEPRGFLPSIDAPPRPVS
jgi:hypothetical protein